MFAMLLWKMTEMIIWLWKKKKKKKSNWLIIFQ